MNAYKCDSSCIVSHNDKHNSVRGNVQDDVGARELMCNWKIELKEVREYKIPLKTPPRHSRSKLHGSPSALSICPARCSLAVAVYGPLRAKE